MEELDLSLCMIVRDEEDHLDRCLSSVSHLVREIIVVDTGSADSSREIAARYKADVIDFKWSGDFAKARNEGLRRAKSSWILVLDADEELAETDAAAIKQMLMQSDVCGFYIQIVNYIGENSREYSTDAVCRLFRNDPRIAYEGRIHEDIEASILAIPGSRIAHAPLVIRHYGYLDEILIKKQKTKRNLAILQEAIDQYPDDPRMRYALGTEYFQSGDYSQALKIYQPLIRQVPVFAGFTSDLVLKSAFCMYKIGKTEQALNLVEEALTFYPDFADLWELKSVLCKELNRLPEALEAANQALQAGSRPMQYSTMSGSGTYRSHYLAGTICERLLRFEDASGHYRNALKYERTFAPAWVRCAWIAFGSGIEREFLAFVSDISGHVPQKIMNVIAEVAVDTGHHEACRILMSQPGCSELHPVFQAMMLVRTGREGKAYSLLQRMCAHPKYGAECCLYLWAIKLKRTETTAAIELLKQLALKDPSFTGIGDLLAENDAEDMQKLPEEALARCQQALIRCDAWDAWIHFLRRLAPYPAVSRLPVSSLYTLLNSPGHIKRAFLDLCRESQDCAAFSERLTFGVIAHSAGHYMDALYWFRSARSINAERLEPLAGLTACFADLARAHYGPVIPSLEIAPHLLLLSSYM